MLTHACDPRTQEVRWKDPMLKAGLDYVVRTYLKDPSAGPYTSGSQTCLACTRTPVQTQAPHTEKRKGEE